MAKPGSTTTSTVASDLGMVSSPLSASRGPTPIPTSTSSEATSMAARTLWEPGAPGRPTSTAYQWKAPSASENERTSRTNRFPLVAFQHDETLFTFSWLAAFFAVFHASFLFNSPLMTFSHPRHSLRLSLPSLTLLYVYTKYVSCLPLCLIFCVACRHNHSRVLLEALSIPLAKPPLLASRLVSSCRSR